MKVKAINGAFGITLNGKWFTYSYATEERAREVLVKLEARRNRIMVAANFSIHPPVKP